MGYDIVILEEKKLAGYRARTSNSDPKMGETIGKLWGKLFGDGVFPAMKNKVNDHTIGLYSDYESDVNGAYDITVGCEVSSLADLPEGMTAKIIPAGRYAHFSTTGDMQEAVAAIWPEIWGTPLERTYTGDFEEYTRIGANGETEIHFYIAVK